MRSVKIFGFIGSAVAAVVVGSAAVGAVPAADAAPALSSSGDAVSPASEPAATVPTPAPGTQSSDSDTSSDSSSSKSSASTDHKGAPIKGSLVTGTPCSTSADACVDLHTNSAWLIHDGKVVYGPVPVAHGAKGYETPAGTFQVSFKDKDHVSSQFDATDGQGAPMPNSVFFNGGVAFHEGSVRQLSHGCVHLSRTASQTFFKDLQPGDVVQVAKR